MAWSSALKRSASLSGVLGVGISRGLGRISQVVSAVAIGDLDRPGHEVAHHLPWTRHEHEYGELDLFGQGMASMETKAHLELLVARGQATREDTSDGVRYSVVTG